MPEVVGGRYHINLSLRRGACRDNAQVDSNRRRCQDGRWQFVCFLCHHVGPLHATGELLPSSICIIFQLFLNFRYSNWKRLGISCDNDSQTVLLISRPNWGQFWKAWMTAQIHRRPTPPFHTFFHTYLLKIGLSRISWVSWTFNPEKIKI